MMSDLSDPYVPVHESTTWHIVLLIIGGCCLAPLSIVFEKASFMLHAIINFISLAFVSTGVIFTIMTHYNSNIVEWDAVMKYSALLAGFCWFQLLTLLLALYFECSRKTATTTFSFGSVYNLIPLTDPYEANYSTNDTKKFVCLSSTPQRHPSTQFHLNHVYLQPLAVVGLILAIISESYGLCEGKLYGNCFSHFAFGLCAVIYGFYFISLGLKLASHSAVIQTEASASILIGILLVITQHGWPFRFFATSWNVTDLVHVGIGGFFFISGIGGLLFSSPYSPVVYLKKDVPNLFPCIPLIATGILMNWLPQTDSFTQSLHSVFGVVILAAGILRLISAVCTYRLNYFVGLLLVVGGCFYTGIGDGSTSALQFYNIDLVGYIMVLIYAGLGAAIHYTLLSVLYMALSTRVSLPVAAQVQV